MSGPASQNPSSGGTGPRPTDLDAAAEENRVRPFRIDVPEEALVDLRRRAAATRWPDREIVTDQSQGVQLGTVRELVRYWGTDYDWREVEAKLNALPQFVTQIDRLDVQFVHVRSRHPNAVPMIITHGWPGSVMELLKVIGPLTDPTAYGGRAEDAFDLNNGDPAPSGLSAAEQAAFDQLADLYRNGPGYSGIMVTRPETSATAWRICLPVWPPGYMTSSPLGPIATASLSGRSRKRDARRHYPLLAHEHRDLFCSALLGE